MTPRSLDDVASSRDETSRWIDGVTLRRLLVLLSPAAAMALLIVDVWPNPLDSILAVILFFLAPGALAWHSLPNIAPGDGPLALPGLWLMGSYIVLTPVLAATLFLGLTADVAEIYLLMVLILLGLLGAGQSFRPLERPTSWELAAGAGAAGAFAYRAFTWQQSGDFVTYLGFIRPLAEGSRYPDFNPFIVGDIPLAPRWLLDGWTVSEGIVSHLGNVSAENLYYRLLPPILVVVALSAIYYLTRRLTGNRRLASLAMFAVIGVGLMTGGGKTDFKFFFQSIVQNKYAALTVLLPVVLALAINAVTAATRARLILAAMALIALTFAHPVVAVMAGALLVAYYLLRHLTITPRPENVWRRLIVIMMPFLVLAGAVSLASDPYGVRLGDIQDIADFASPAHVIGPVTVWEPDIPNIDDFAPDESSEYFVTGHAVSASPRVGFLAIGLPFAHWSMLDNPANLVVVLALLVILIARRREPAAIWILAASAVVASVFFLPPVAAVVGRFITPWQLWRFSWLIPVPFALAWLLETSFTEFSTRWRTLLMLAVGSILIFTISVSNYRNLWRDGPPRAVIKENSVVDQLGDYRGVLIGSPDIVNQAVANSGGLYAVSFRGAASMSNAFPTARNAEAFQRLRDDRLFMAEGTEEELRRTVLTKYGVDLVVLDKTERQIIHPKSIGLELVDRLGAGYWLYEVKE